MVLGVVLTSAVPPPLPVVSQLVRIPRCRHDVFQVRRERQGATVFVRSPSSSSSVVRGHEAGAVEVHHQAGQIVEPAAKVLQNCPAYFLFRLYSLPYYLPGKFVIGQGRHLEQRQFPHFPLQLLISQFGSNCLVRGQLRQEVSGSSPMTIKSCAECLLYVV